MKTEINAKIKICVNTAVISFKWTQNKLNKIGRKTGQLKTGFRMQHPKPDIERLCVQRIEVRRGLMQLENLQNNNRKTTKILIPEASRIDTNISRHRQNKKNVCSF